MSARDQWRRAQAAPSTATGTATRFDGAETPVDGNTPGVRQTGRRCTAANVLEFSTESSRRTSRTSWPRVDSRMSRLTDRRPSIGETPRRPSTTSVVTTPSPSESGQSEGANSIVLEDQWADVVADIEGFEVLDPPFGGQQRIVRSEEDLVPQHRVGGPHKLRGEVLRRPPRQVDVDVGLVLRDGDRGVLPRHGRVRHD